MSFTRWWFNGKCCIPVLKWACNYWFKITAISLRDLFREFSGRVRPAAADFPRDVCLTVSRNHKIILLYVDVSLFNYKWPLLCAVVTCVVCVCFVYSTHPVRTRSYVSRHTFVNHLRTEAFGKKSRYKCVIFRDLENWRQMANFRSRQNIAAGLTHIMNITGTHYLVTQGTKLSTAMVLSHSHVCVYHTPQIRSHMATILLILYHIYI